MASWILIWSTEFYAFKPKNSFNYPYKIIRCINKKPWLSNRQIWLRCVFEKELLHRPDKECHFNKARVTTRVCEDHVLSVSTTRKGPSNIQGESLLSPRHNFITNWLSKLTMDNYELKARNRLANFRANSWANRRRVRWAMGPERFWADSPDTKPVWYFGSFVSFAGLLLANGLGVLAIQPGSFYKFMLRGKNISVCVIIFYSHHAWIYYKLTKAWWSLHWIVG